MKKIKNAGFTLSELLFVLGFFSVVGLVGYVAVHFISKIW
jgi:type II secretory pathway component PulJ